MTTTPYKPRGLCLRLGCLLSIAAATPALAQTYTQTQIVPFNFSNSGNSSPLVVVSPGGFQGTFQPFNPAGGTLVSFEVAWHMTLTGSGIAGDPSGTIGNMGPSGGYFINGINYSGNGDGDGDGGPVGELLTMNFIVSETQPFLASDAGIGYSAGILAAVLGASSFPIQWNASYGVEGDNAHSLTGTAIGSVRLTYTYLPEASTNVAMGFAFAAVGGVVWRRRTTATRRCLSRHMSLANHVSLPSRSSRPTLSRACRRRS